MLAQLQAAQDAVSNPPGKVGPNALYDALKSESRWYNDDPIDGARWNKLFPYQLAIYKVTDGRSDRQYTFTLPMAPEALSVTMPFASTVTATLGGIVEENNGAPFRLLSFTGTTGVVPLKGSAKQASDLSTSRGIFAGTINASNNTMDSVKAVATGKTVVYSNLIDPEPENDILKSTGYYQFRLLQRFLEGYAALKKGTDGNQYRLAVCMWKDEAVYYVTPQVFAVNRTAADPYSYNYSLQFKAWRRTTDQGTEYQAPNVPTVAPDWLQNVKNRINYVRDVIQGGQDVLNAVRSDLGSAVWDTVRQVTLVADDALGLGVSLSSFPSSVIADCKNSVAQVASLKEKEEYLERVYGDRWKEIKEWLFGDDDVNTNTNTNALAVRPPGAASGAGGSTPDGANAAWNGFSEQELQKTPSISAKIESEKRRVRGLTADDYQAMQAENVRNAAAFAEAVGATTSVYKETYGFSSSPVLKSEPSEADYEVLFALNELNTILDKFITANTKQQTLSAVEYIGGLATKSGIAFETPVSKFGVPFPYGSSLESLALRYLGDANRWHEIAALNGLQTPFIDEVGFNADLLVNGDGNQIVVSNTYSEKLFIGQPVWIGSNVVSRSKRQIRGITPIGSSLYILLSGDANLDNYRTADLASIHAYLPYTVNSQQLIYIPSQDAVEGDDFRTDKIPSVDETDKLLRIGGLDLLLTSDSDLVVTPTGDGGWSYGMTNIVQWLKIGMSTPRGALVQHPNFGIDIVPGTSVADTSATEMAKSIRNLVSINPAFSGLESVSVTVNGPTADIAAAVGIKGISSNIPIVTTVRV